MGYEEALCKACVLLKVTTQWLAQGFKLDSSIHWECNEFVDWNYDTFQRMYLSAAKGERLIHIEMYVMCIVSGTKDTKKLFISQWFIVSRSMILCFIFREKLLHLGVEENDSGPVNSQVIIVFISVFALFLYNCCWYKLL